MLIWAIFQNFIKENPTADLSILKRERERDFANASDRWSCKA
jgi:hypothetical protein